MALYFLRNRQEIENVTYAAFMQTWQNAKNRETSRYSHLGVLMHYSTMVTPTVNLFVRIGCRLLTSETRYKQMVFSPFNKLN